MSLDELIIEAVNTYLSSFEKQDVDGILKAMEQMGFSKEKA